MVKIQDIINELKRWFPNREKDDDCPNLSDESLDVIINALKSYDGSAKVETKFKIADIHKDKMKLVSSDSIVIEGKLSEAINNFIKDSNYFPSDFRVVRRISGSDCKWYAVPDDLDTDGEELLFEERI